MKVHDWNISSNRGSVLMEFVLVLPVYMAVIGGILWLGLKSLDAVNLRSADHWGSGWQAIVFLYAHRQ